MLAIGTVEYLDVIEHIVAGLGSGFVDLAPYPFALELSGGSAPLLVALPGQVGAQVQNGLYLSLEVLSWLRSAANTHSRRPFERGRVIGCWPLPSQNLESRFANERNPKRFSQSMIRLANQK